MLAGRLFGEALVEVSPLPPRGPCGGGGTALEEVSLGTYDGRGVLENDGEMLALSAACGAVGGGRGLGAGPCGDDDFAGVESAEGEGPWRAG